MRSFMICTFHPVLCEFASDKIEKNEMSAACSADGEGEKRVQGFGGETRGKETTRKNKA
jgi:hypothetical protein